jgi:hypothetical protein
MLRHDRPYVGTFRNAFGWAATALLVFGAPQKSTAQAALYTPAEKARLIELTRQDPVAKAEFEALKEKADKALSATPHPIATIQSEGKLANDPVKIATLSALGDMTSLWALGYAYEITGDPRYADKARAFILAWTAVNNPTGDPIDETNLEPLFVAYDQTRTTFSPKDRYAADAYLRLVIRAEHEAHKVTNNWQSHRLKVVGLAAYVLKDDELIAQALQGYRDHVPENLLPDGSTFDFHERDALHYHVYDLEPLLALAIAAHNNGVDLYHYTSTEGGSLAKSVAFLIPFCTGEQEHHEFVNSKTEFDRKRAANGEKGYIIGHLFTRIEGFKALSLAAYLDNSVDPVVIALSSKNSDPVLAWNLVLAQAAQAH